MQEKFKQKIDLNTKNNKALLKEFKEYLNKQKDISYSWIEILNIIKIAILELIY